jgi:hypothetical protein
MRSSGAKFCATPGTFAPLSQNRACRAPYGNRTRTIAHAVLPMLPELGGHSVSREGYAINRVTQAAHPGEAFPSISAI